jgi:hypothetical protein
MMLTSRKTTHKERYEMPTNYKNEVQERNSTIWKNRVEIMDLLKVPEGFKAHKEKDIYLRFTSFIQENFSRIMSRKDNPEYTTSGLHMDRAFEKFPIPENWWGHAKKVRGGDKSESNPLIEIGSKIERSQYMKDDINCAVMPIYRAIKDRFERRWFFEYFFNHDQYVAERDSLKAIEGLVMATTGQTIKDINNELEAHRKTYPDDKDAIKMRVGAADRIRKYISNPDKLKAQERKAVEKYNERLLKFDPETNTRPLPNDYANLHTFLEYKNGLVSRGSNYYFPDPKKQDAKVDVANNDVQDFGRESVDSERNRFSVDIDDNERQQQYQKNTQPFIAAENSFDQSFDELDNSF